MLIQERVYSKLSWFIYMLPERTKHFVQPYRTAENSTYLHITTVNPYNWPLFLIRTTRDIKGLKLNKLFLCVLNISVTFSN